MENVATVLTVYGIETREFSFQLFQLLFSVATVLAVYGIETLLEVVGSLGPRLQQYLPFTVLKLSS